MRRSNPMSAVNSCNWELVILRMVMMIVIEKSPNCGNEDGHDGDIGGDDDDDAESKNVVT